MDKINLKDLSAEQRQAMMAELQAAEDAAERHREEEIATYKLLVSDAVRECFPTLQTVSAMLTSTKQAVRDKFAAALAVKAELYGVKEGQQSHNFISDDGRYRVRMGYNVIDNYDDTAESGVAMVKEYLQGLSGESAGAQTAVKLALSLLAKDSKGTLKASRIITLRKQALESGARKFIEGVDIIMKAYKPIESKQYVRAEYKDDNGVWKSVPLGMTEAD